MEMLSSFIGDIYIYNDTENVLSDLQNTEYCIVINKTAKGNFKNTLFQ